MTEDEKDFEYIREFISGSEEAYNQIARKYSQKIYWHARRMLGNHMDADEITQEVLIVIYEKIRSFSFRSSLYTWIYRITSNRCINLLNRRKLKQLMFLGDDEYESLSDQEDIVAGVENRERLRRLDGMLKQLPPRQREVFILKNFEEMTYEEISEVTGKSIGGLKANYFHAIKKITEMSGNDE